MGGIRNVESAMRGAPTSGQSPSASMNVGSMASVDTKSPTQIWDGNEECAVATAVVLVSSLTVQPANINAEKMNLGILMGECRWGNPYWGILKYR